MTWSQTWSGNFLEKTPTDMWKRNLDDERIIALDDMPGWDKVITPDVIRAGRNIVRKAEISLQGKDLAIALPQAGVTAIAIFDITGHRIKTLNIGVLDAGTHAFSLQGLAQGSYIVQVKSGNERFAQKIQIK